MDGEQKERKEERERERGRTAAAFNYAGEYLNVFIPLSINIIQL